MARRKERCSMEGCIRPTKHTGLCNTCYQYMHYWLKKRSVAAIANRMRNVKLYENRLSALLGGKVTNITKKRRKSA